MTICKGDSLLQALVDCLQDALATVLFVWSCHPAVRCEAEGHPVVQIYPGHGAATSRPPGHPRTGRAFNKFWTEAIPQAPADGGIKHHIKPTDPVLKYSLAPCL